MRSVEIEIVTREDGIARDRDATVSTTMNPPLPTRDARSSKR